MTYTRVNWQDSPDTTTPIDAANLNVMDEGIATLDAAVAPGTQLDFEEITSSQSPVTATTEGTSVSAITGNSVSYDGSRVKIEFWAPGVNWSSGPVIITGVFFRDTTPLGQWIIADISTNVGGRNMTPGVLFDTPGSGSHTYAVKTFVTGNSAFVRAGTGGTGNDSPAFLRVTKA